MSNYIADRIPAKQKGYNSPLVQTFFVVRSR